MTDRLLSKKHVCRMLGIARATLDRRRKQPSFPEARTPEGNRSGPCYWLESEILRYMQTMPTTKPT